MFNHAKPQSTLGAWQVMSIEASNFLSFRSIKWKFQQTTFVISGSHVSSGYNSGYVSNGSGKTSFIESIHTAIFGKSMTGRRISQCLRYGTKQMTLQVELEHSDGQKLSIFRRVINGKSSALKVLFNGEPIQVTSNSDLPLGFISPVDGNKWILRCLGLSTEDVSSFYFVSPATYKPFFLRSERERTDLFKRLSNVTVMDDVSDRISSSLKDQDREVEYLENEVSCYDRDIALLSDVLENSENLFVEEVLEDMSFAGDEHTFLSEKLEKKEEELIVLTSELSKIPRPDDSVNKKLEIVEKQCSDQERELSLLLGDMRATSTRAEDLSKQRDLLDQQDREVECPACKHTFSVLSVLNAVESVRIHKERADIKDSISKNETESILNRRKHSTLAIQLRKSIKERDLIKKELRDSTKGWVELSCKVANVKAEITSINEKRADIDNILKALHRKRAKGYQGHEGVKIQEAKAGKKLYTAKVEKSQKKREVIKSAGRHANTFSIECCHRMINVFCTLTNSYLSMVDSGLFLKYTGVKKLKSGEERIHTLPIITNNSVEVEYSSLSFGERARLNVCIELVIQGFINTNSEGGGLNIYVNDEAMAGCDINGIKKLYLLFEKLGKLIMFVTHAAGSIEIERQIAIRHGKDGSFVSCGLNEK